MPEIRLEHTHRVRDSQNEFLTLQTLYIVVHCMNNLYEHGHGYRAIMKMFVCRMTVESKYKIHIKLSKG